MSKFYDIETLDFQDFALEAWGFAVKTVVEVLDCAKSFARQPTKYDPVEFFNLFGHRKLHKIFKYHDNAFGNGKDAYEVGCCTMDASSYDADFFLFIYLSVEDGEKLIKKYNIKEFK